LAFPKRKAATLASYPPRRIVEILQRRWSWRTLRR
jgi:hypothetical protein